ncbi:MAG: hypothetical protein ACLFVR_14325 [Thiohalospira sp.]
MKTAFKSSFVILLLFFSAKTFSQVGIAHYYPDVISFSYSPFSFNQSAIGGELKTFTNKKMRDIQLELDAFYHFKPREYHRFSVGIGFKTDPFTDGGDGNVVTFPVVFEIYPIQKFKKLSVNFELAPELYLEEQPYTLRSLLGLRYYFGE